MKRLDRYVLSIFVIAVSVTLLFLCGLYVIVHFLTHIRYIEKSQPTFAAADLSVPEGFLVYYALHLPEILVLLGPYALLFGAMYTVHHLGRNNELTPMFVVGVSRLRVVTPIFLATALAALGLVAIREKQLPAQLDRMDEISRRLRGDDDPIKDDMGLARDAKNNVVVFSSYNEETKSLYRAHLKPADTREASGRWDELRWNRRRARFEAGEGAVDSALPFHELSDLELVDLADERKRIRRLGYRDLARLHRRTPDDRRIESAMHERLAYPFRPFVLLLMGLPFVLRTRERNVFAGLATCLVLSLAYFVTTQIFERLGTQSEVINPLLGAWLPVIVFACVGLVLFESKS